MEVPSTPQSPESQSSPHSIKEHFEGLRGTRYLNSHDPHGPKVYVLEEVRQPLANVDTLILRFRGEKDGTRGESSLSVSSLDFQDDIDSGKWKALPSEPTDAL